MKILTELLVMVTIAGAMAVETSPLFDNSGFEKGSLENWKATGEAFKMQPTKGDNTKARGRESSKLVGNYWVGTYESYNGKTGQAGRDQGDGPVGQITSKEFLVEKKFINFLVGGGAHKETCVRILVDGKQYQLSSGFNSETMKQVSADVSQFRGNKAQIMVIDNATGGWGHVNADEFTASNEALATKAVKPIEASKVKAKPAAKRRARKPLSGEAQEMTFKCKQQFLILPIDNDAGKPQISLAVDGAEVRFVTGALAVSKDDIDWWAFFDISEYKGKEATLKISGLADAGLKLIEQARKVPGSESWGDEATRPQFHYSQRVGWNNDPNGMVYYKGEWHLYLQHNPVGLPWGNMTWAHGISKDLCNWDHLPNVLHHKRGDAMFSGGAAVDWKNHSGWKTGTNDLILATWTSTGRGECIAYSNDKGRTFTEYEGNPVINHRGRDPKPIWYEYDKKDVPLNDKAKEMGGHWVIAVYDEEKDIGRNIALYSSTDLKKWKLESNLPGYYECAELFELPVDGDKKNTRWAIFAADAKYAVGEFDGRTFTPEHEGKYQLHQGPYYASQCFSDAPDGRVVQIGWARIAMGNTCFNQTFSFPTDLTLRNTKQGVRMFGNPAKEIENIHGKKHEAENELLNDEKGVELAMKGDCFDIRAAFKIGTAKEVKLMVDGHDCFTFNAESKEANGQQIEIDDGKVSVQILIDRSIREIFIDNGERVLTSKYDNDLNLESVKVVATGGEAKLISLEAIELDASWK